MEIDIILVDEPAPHGPAHHDEPAREAQQPHPPAARGDPRTAAGERPGPRRPRVRSSAAPGRRSRPATTSAAATTGYEHAVLHAGRRRAVAAPRHRGLDEHLGSRQAGDRAGARLLPRRRQRARDRLRPRLHGRRRADGLSRRCASACPTCTSTPWFLGMRKAMEMMLTGDSITGIEAVERRLGQRGVPGRRARRARARGRAPHRGDPARARAAQQARRAPPDGRDGPARRHPRRHRALRARHAHPGDARVRRRRPRRRASPARCRSATRPSATTAPAPDPPCRPRSRPTAASR